MAISTVDAKQRVVLPAARPGDVFDIQSQGEGRLLLVRLERPEPGPRMSMARCLEAIAAAPLRPKMTWDSLKAVTRDRVAPSCAAPVRGAAVPVPLKLNDLYSSS